MKDGLTKKLVVIALMACLALPAGFAASAFTDISTPASVSEPGTESHEGEYYYDGTWYNAVIVVGADKSIDGDVAGGLVMSDFTCVIDGDFYQNQPLIIDGGHLIIKGNLYSTGSVALTGGTLTVEGDFVHSNGTFSDCSIEVGGDFTQGKNIDLNGIGMSVGGNYYQKSGLLNVNGAELRVGENYLQTDGTLDLNGGKLQIDGDYRLQSVTENDNGTVTYGRTFGVLKMNDEADYMTVGGNMHIQSYYGSGASYNDITNGTLELKGDFHQYTAGDSSGDSFNAKDNHKVFFSGEGIQAVTFEGTDSGFNYLLAGQNTEVNFKNARITSLGSDVTVRNLTQYGNMTLGGHTLTVKQNVVQTGNIYGDGGTMNVSGNYTQTNGTLDLNGGKLQIDGDYRLQSVDKNDDGSLTYGRTYGVLKMNDADDYMTVGGDMHIQSYWGSGASYNDITNGTLELKGDFYQYTAGDSSGDSFNAKGDHKVFFSGEGVQTVTFDGTSSGFNSLIAGKNTEIDFINARITTLGSDVTVRSLTQYGTMSLGGYTLTVNQDIVQTGTIYGDGGTMNVSGNYTQTNGTLDLNGGKLQIDGNYRLQSVDKNDDGSLTYGRTYGVLKMNDEADYMTVGGDMHIQSYWGSGASYNDITNGTLELKGNFYQYTAGDSSSDSFNAKGDHKVFFSGEGVQTVTFDGTSSGFNSLIAGKNTEIDFINARITTLGSDVTVRSLTQYGTMSLGGYTLTVNQDIVQTGTIYGDGGTMNVSGNYTQTNGTLDLNGGKLQIDGNYRLQSVNENDDGTVTYGRTFGVLKMNDRADYMLVGGDMHIQSYYGSGASYNDLTNGILELKGNFYQYTAADASGDSFNAKNNHKVKFTGSKKQIASFAGENSGFCILTKGTNQNVDIKGRVTKLGSTVYLANFEQNGSFSNNGYTLNISGKMTQKGDVDIKKGTIKVKRSYYHTNGRLTLGGGVLNIGGNYRLQSMNAAEDGTITYGRTNGVLKMNNADDYMTVGGDMHIQSYYGSGASYNDITNGTLELKGNFYQYTANGASGDNFNAKGDHKVFFSGEGVQTVTFEGTSSGFNSLIAGSNTEIDFINARITTLGSDVTVRSLTQYGTMTLGGYTLTVNKDVVQTGTIYGDGGTMNVKGNYTQANGTFDLNGAIVQIDGDYRLQSVNKNDDGSLTYGRTYGVLKMNDADDYMTVGGDMHIQSYYGSGASYNDITNGTLELKGNFYQYTANGASSDNFNAKGTHKVKFTGTAKQTVNFEGSSSGFAMLMGGTNENVVISSGRIRSLGENAVLQSFTQYGDLDLNGKKLVVKGNMNQTGNVSVNKGRFVVQGYYNHRNGTLDLNGGRLEVTKSYSLKDGTNNSYGVLKMNDPTDYFLVKGNFITKSYWGKGANYNDLTNGILELRGSFSQLKGSGDNFRASGRHLTMFTGDQPAAVTFESPKSSGFCYVLFAKMTREEYLGEDSPVMMTYYGDPNTVLNYSYLDSNKVVTGGSVNAVMQVYGGTAPYSSAVYYKAKKDSDYQLLQEGQNLTAIPVKLTDIGEYDIKLVVTDSNGSTDEYYDTLTVVKPLENHSELESQQVKLGQNIVVKCAAEGGSGEYQYEISIRKTSETTFTKLRDYSDSATFTIKAEEVGNFEILVRVRDGFGKVIKKKMSLTVDNKLENLSTLSATEFKLGDTITVNGAADGGEGAYTYAVLYKKASATKWITLQNYSENNTVEIKPAVAVDYDVCVKVKDEKGTISKLYYTLTAIKEFENTSSLSAESITLGQSVKIKGSSKNGEGDCTYAYYYKKSTSDKWSTLKDFSATTAVSLKPGAAVSYDVMVKAQDSTGKVVEKTMTLTVTK